MSFSRDLNGLSCPEEGILLSEITRETGVKLPELKGYVKELERLGKVRGTGDITWLPAGLPEDTVSLVAPRISQGNPTRPGPSGSQRISFSGWPIIPSVSTKEPNQKSRRKPPIGDAKLANAACAALPSNISDEAQKLLYELITRRGHETAVGVSLITISRETGLYRTLLLQYAKELENDGRAGLGTGGCWVPKRLPAVP
jgi:hypothetical protein